MQTLLTYIIVILLLVFLIRLVFGKYFTRFILFLFAYIPIYIVIIIKTINFHLYNHQNKEYSFNEVIENNIIPINLVLLILFLIFSFLYYENKSLKAHGNPKFEIKSIENNNKEYVTYLGTYILPFVAIETKGIPDVIAYVFLFVLMGFIFTRTNLIFTNPMLLFFDYDIFEVIDTDNNKHLCISKEKFKVGESPIGVRLGEKTFIIQKWKKEILEKK